MRTTTIVTIKKALTTLQQRRRQQRFLSSSTSWRRSRGYISTTTTNNDNNNICQTNFIFGANTDVGKTVLTAGLIRAAASASPTRTTKTNHYVKPLQCGGSDQGFVKKHAPNVSSTTTIFEWDTPASPHVASRKENKPVSDQQVCQGLEDCLIDLSSSTTTSSGSSASAKTTTIWVETAGGVLSPSSSSPDNDSISHARSSGYDDDDDDDDDNTSSSCWGWVTQGDLYQPFTNVGSTILIGDGRLGGISATLSALESLIIRGYDIAGIILLETGYSNQKAIQEYVSRQLKLRTGDGTPLFSNPQASIISLPQLPPEPEPLTEWYESQQVTDTLESFVQDHLQKEWENRIIRRKEEQEEAAEEEDDDNIHMGGGGGDSTTMALTMSAAYSSYGKYHAKYPTNQLSQKLLNGNKWANRVVFCRDDKSAIRLAVNMGMEQFQSDQPNTSSYDVALVCSQSHQRDIKLDCTTVQLKAATLRRCCSVDDGSTTSTWSLSDYSEDDESFQTKDEAFDVKSRRKSTKDNNIFLQYQINIAREWDAIERLCRIASVMIVSPPGTTEAGGGIGTEQNEIVDPLWQHALWTVATSRNVPVIIDGRQSVGWHNVIGCDHPDLVVAKLDGVGPLGAVIASEWIKNGTTTSCDGHSFTPTAVECVSAIHAMEGYPQ